MNASNVVNFNRNNYSDYKKMTIMLHSILFRRIKSQKSIKNQGERSK